MNLIEIFSYFILIKSKIFRFSIFSNFTLQYIKLFYLGYYLNTFIKYPYNSKIFQHTVIKLIAGHKHQTQEFVFLIPEEFETLSKETLQTQRYKDILNSELTCGRTSKKEEFTLDFALSQVSTTLHMKQKKQQKIQKVLLV